MEPERLAILCRISLSANIYSDEQNDIFATFATSLHEYETNESLPQLYCIYCFDTIKKTKNESRRACRE